MLGSDFDRRQSLLARAAEGGLDHVFIADHVSFHDGRGMDGLINAATLLAAQADLAVCVGVYLLALRHPVTVARQIASLAHSAPGRLIFGVGVGGEDRHEIEVCGVDPCTRGRRTDEALGVLRRLLTGETVTHAGEFFQLDRATILPPPDPPVPIVVGGRSSAAVERARRFGDGWLGAWCSPRRLADVAAGIEANAQEPAHGWQHGMQIWVGFDDRREAARERIAREMEAFYKVPFDKFERYSPYGTPDDVVGLLREYADAGCRIFNLKPVAPTEEHGIDAVVEVARLLRAS